MDAALQEAARLDSAGEAYVLVTVVQTKPPSSATPGARAVVLPDGRVIGFVGGECTRNVMLEVAGEALADGRSRRLLLSPEVELGVEVPGSTTILRRMSCDSGGAVELFLEPRLALTPLVVIGDSPVAIQVQALAASLPWRVQGLAPAEAGGFDQLERQFLEVLEPGAYLVIATMGRFDDWAIDAIGTREPAYIGVVASRRRGDLLRLRWLDHYSTPPTTIFAAPAGLDLGSRHPGDIALSILAQVTQLRQQGATPALSSRLVTGSSMVIDPVCGMHVDLRNSPYRYELDGILHGFCAASCRDAFIAHPDRYRSA